MRIQQGENHLPALSCDSTMPANRLPPSRRRSWRLWALASALTATTALPAIALDIDGVQPAALDQPRVNLLVIRPPAAFPAAHAAARSAAGAAHSRPTGQVLSAAVDGNRVVNVEAFLDTGASSSVLSFHTVNQLGVQSELAGNGDPVRFTDVGLGGTSAFSVSEPLVLAIAASDIDTQAAMDPRGFAINYPLTIGPQRLEIGPLTESNDLLASLAVADLDVIGMPAITGRVIVMDMSAVNKVSDKIRTTLIDPRSPTAAGQIPPTRLHVRLSHAGFAAFTRTSPAGADPPAIVVNPFVGPPPLTSAAAASAPPTANAGSALSLSYGGKVISGSWLLDTGAVSSMISQKSAAALGIRYAASTLGSDHPRLEGVPGDRQFTMNVAGVGGAGRHAAGFYLDGLTLRTLEGEPLHFLHAPVLVTDITMKDQTDGHLFTLDGVLGMNFLTASAKLDTSNLLPDVTNLTAGAFRYVVVDERNSKRGPTLGVTPN
jgi:hypothetical protein